MGQSSYIRAQQFKSRLSVVAGFLLRSRETQGQRAKTYAEENEQLKRSLEEKERLLAELAEQLEHKEQRIAQLEAEYRRLRQQPPMLPDDPPLPHHGFGAKVIALCVNLARRIGLRAVPEVLKIVFDWLGAQTKIPSWTTIRIWLLRVGVAAIRRPIEKADDWVWMADHSNQIGPEKVLSIIGIRASDMPPPGQAIKHEHVRLLELTPGTSWKREDMAEAYQQLAKRAGTPLAVVVDGATELREGAETLQKNGQKPVILPDFKHYAANVMKKIVGADQSFSEFSTQVGRTRSTIQQTELAHFTPPSPKPKARFMNLKATLHWAKMVLWHLSNPCSQACKEITMQRLNEKLGWLEAFRDNIQRWTACQDVVSACLTFINRQGLFKGAARQLRDHLRALRQVNTSSDKAGDVSRRVTARLLKFLREAESKLEKDQRLPMSTEILESSFGLFKQIERQHSKGGFTSLLAAYGSLLQASTPETIRRDFALISVNDIKEWVAEKLGATLTSKRKTAYHEFHCAS